MSRWLRATLPFILAASVDSFVPARSIVKVLPGTPVVSSLEASNNDDIFSRLNADELRKSSEEIFQNTMKGGKPGERGEVYVISQAVLFVLLALGGIPGLDGPFHFLFGPILLWVAATLMLASINDMGASLSPWPVPAGNKLITDGVFGFVRHPIYAAVLLGGFAISIWTESSSRLIVTMALYVLFDLKSDFEEEKLIEQYGREYEEYRVTVSGKFVPSSLLSELPWNKDEE